MTVTPPAPPQFLTTTALNGVITLAWSAEPGWLYQLQSCADLTQPRWGNVGDASSTINAAITGFDTGSAGNRD